jgi:uncharacterized membrane protein
MTLINLVYYETIYFKTELVILIYFINAATFPYKIDQILNKIKVEARNALIREMEGVT